MKVIGNTALLSSMLIFTSASSSCAADALLADAAERADWDQVGTLLQHDADVNAAQVDGMTALHWASWHDHTKTAVRLVDSGADVAAKNRYGATALSLACTNGNAALVGKLLKSGADANSSLPGGETVLMTAARTGAFGSVEALLAHGADVNATERKQQTAIMWAAAEGHADIVSALIEADADIKTTLKSGFSPLFFAVREGRVDAVDVLLAAGVDVNGTMQPETKGGRVPRNGTSPLLLAVENGHFELAVHLLAAGADADDQRSGFTPLHVVSWVRKPNLGDGIDGEPAPIGSGNVTSLQFVKKVVKHGADVNARLKRGRSGRGKLNHKGATPFFFASDTADVPLMKLLLELGADPTLMNEDHCPPLLAAAGIGTHAPGEEAGTEDVQLLLKLGADINAVDDNGETAMHGATYGSLPKMVAFLADHGADISVWNNRNEYGWTPLLIAEGHRPGNFKPAAATIAAVHRAMRAAGVEPPEPTPRRVPLNNDQYSSDKTKKPTKPKIQ